MEIGKQLSKPHVNNRSDQPRDPVEPMQYMEHLLFLLMLRLWYM